MSKKAKTPPAPPTVLVITLEADGSGSLLTRRGDLAHLSQFQYRGMPEIIAAIQTGAAQLADLEQHPPVIDAPPISSAEPSDTVPDVDAILDEPEAEEADAPQSDPDSSPATPTHSPSDTQARLF
jgi:hypothetical protein